MQPLKLMGSFTALLNLAWAALRATATFASPGRRRLGLRAGSDEARRLGRKQGRKRLMPATGPDSINAKDVFRAHLRYGRIEDARDYLQLMKSYRTAEPWMDRALEQARNDPPPPLYMLRHRPGPYPGRYR